MVETYTPFCRACEDFHEESTCHYACYVQEHGFPEGCGPRASSSEPEYINNVGDMHNISRESWREAKQHSQKIDNLTKCFSEKPSKEQVNNMQKFHGCDLPEEKK